MKESYFFRPIKEEVEKKKEAVEVKPITADEHEETEQRPMTLKDHWLSLRQSIQEKITFEKPTQEEQEKTKLLSELITPELMTEYKQILRGFNVKAKKTEEHPQREFIDINNEEFSADIESWIENLITEVKSKRETGLDESDIEELRAQCWLLFDSVGNVMNTKSLEKEIGEFYKDKNEEVGEKEAVKQKSELIKQLQGRYPLDKIEIEILVDLIKSEKDENENYSPKILAETIARLWGEYKLGEKKGTIAKISLGYLMSKGVESFAPSLFQNIIAQDKFNVAVFLEYFGLNKLSEVIDAKTEIELAKVMNEINHQINERITNSLFFQEFEFIHEKSLGEIYATLERGKNSTEQILQDTISKFAPTLAGIAMSLAFLTKINPALGAIGVGSLPIMYKIAKKQNEQIWPMYEKEKREGEKISTRLGSIKSGFEEVKTSPETPTIATHVKEQMDVKDTLSLQRFIEETKNRLKSMIPFDVSTVVSAGVGGALQEAGMISGGAVLSNIIYSNQLNRPVQELVNLYFNRFSRYIQDIQRMDEIFGQYEKLDLPEGEKEKDRVPVSELENFDISVKNLRYKNILRGVSLDIKQGEFITIAGASGAGKSTLLRNLVGLYKAESGEIEVGGVKNDRVKKYGKESLYSVMSYCNQNPQIFDGMTLRENLLLWSKDEVNDEKIKKVLEDLHLDKFADKLDEEAKHLSGGEKVRIGVARTLIKGAKIMLLDEPTASLDSQAATEVRKIISEINEKYPDTTIICVSHDEELIKTSKRSVNMADLQK
ncbi:MAG: ABC transporter ATP-binding protein [Candidatus Shapirobacteria bacterium]|nr:ABC transporter ATP-binding protein [Candidatus Shapirobacteria bacterium]